MRLWWYGHWEVELRECKTLLYYSLYICALIYAKYWLSKLQNWSGIDPKVEMSAHTEKSVHLCYFLNFISFSCLFVCLFSFFFSFFFMIHWMFAVISFPGCLSVCNLIIHRPSGCSFYLMSVYVSLPLCFEKSKKRPEPKSGLTGSAVVCHFSNSIAEWHY